MGLAASIKKLLGSRVPITKDHVGAGLRYGGWLYNEKRPIFTNYMAQAMLDDPHIQFGLRLIKGPILAQSRFYVQCENEEVRQFIIKQINRFWERGVKYAMRSMEYGWYGTEVMYRTENMQLMFDRFRNIDPIAVRPWIIDGSLTGILVQKTGNPTDGGENVYVGSPKCFWTVHSREVNRWWGRSRLYGPHVPWYEYNASDGFRDSRNLWFYKCAFDAGTIHFPFGVTILPDGSAVDNQDIAAMQMDAARNGAGKMIPTSPSPEKNWEWDPPVSVDLSQSFSEYGASLREEMWEGLGVPGEVAQAEGTGAYAGRQIPQEAFYSLLQEIVQDIMADFDEQILQPLVRINFGDCGVPYDIECYGLIRNLEEDRGNHKEDARQALGATDGTQGQQTQNPHGAQRGEQLNMSQVCLPQRPTSHRAMYSFTRTGNRD